MTGQLLQIMAETSGVATRRLHEQVLDALVERIVAGDFAVGASLPSEAELCDLYHVSRSSVREALRVLAEKGMIEVRHGLGTRVNPLDRWFFMDPVVLSARRRLPAMAPVLNEMHEAREIFESEIAALAAERAKPVDLERLKTALDDMQKNVGDAAAFAEANFAFHRALIVATGNVVLLRIAAPIRELLEYTLGVSNSVPGALERTLEDHMAIYDAVSGHDREGARKAMHAHLEKAREEIAKLLS